MEKPITLNEQSKLSIEKVTGLKYNDIIRTDSNDLIEKIQKRIGKPLKFKRIKDERLTNRGSVYLYLRRVFEFNSNKLDRYIDHIK